MNDYFVPFEERPKMNFSICTKYDSQFSSYEGIYLIKIGDEYYVGKTNSTFGRRFSNHRVLIKKYLQDIETTGSYNENGFTDTRSTTTYNDLGNTSSNREEIHIPMR